MSVVLGKVHDLTQDVGYKFIDLYSTKQPFAPTFEFKSVEFVSICEDQVTLLISDEQRAEIAHLEACVVKKLVQFFDARASPESLSKLAISSLNPSDSSVNAILYDDSDGYALNVPCDVTLTCDQVFVKRGNVCFGTTLVVRSIRPVTSEEADAPQEGLADDATPQAQEQVTSQATTDQAQADCPTQSLEPQCEH